MSESNIERKFVRDGEKFIVKSEVNESMNEDEFRLAYAQKTKQINDIQDALAQFKYQLSTYKGIIETDEIRKIKEMLVTAEKLKDKDNIVAQIKDFEKNLDKVMKEVREFTPMIIKLENDRKEKDRNDRLSETSKSKTE
jgi:hypothetical protein